MSPRLQESFADFVQVSFPRWRGRRAFDTAVCGHGAAVRHMISRIGIAALWLLGLAVVFAAINKNDPYLISLRGAGNVALAVTSLVTSGADTGAGEASRENCWFCFGDLRRYRCWARTSR
jgi:hypothetical protein